MTPEWYGLTPVCRERRHSLCGGYLCACLCHKEGPLDPTEVETDNPQAKMLDGDPE